ncbi:TPA: hypothetical protein ENX78_18230, partial [Candidatus Poribacteria bacterium]|nr:hypothetical protein [Candidatus Poribacteria bacterium]
MENRLTKREFIKGLAMGLSSVSLLMNSETNIFGDTKKEKTMQNDDLYYIQTVRGRIKPSQLGMTLIHEHILVDFIGADK